MFRELKKESKDLGTWQFLNHLVGGFFSKKAASVEALTDVGLMVILNNHVSSAGWSGIPTAQPLGDVI